MTGTAKIIGTDGDLAEIEVRRKSMCDGCEKNKCSSSCAASGLMGNTGKMRTRALNKVGALPGDTVEIESSDRRILSLALLVFILPVLVCILFYYISAAIGFEGFIPVISSAAGLVISFTAIGLAERIHRKKMPDITVVAVIHHSNENENENN